MPIIGPQSRTVAEPRRMSADITPSVVSAARCAPSASSWVASGNRRGTTDARVMESIISTVPPTTGVTTRRMTKSHLVIASCPMPQTMTRAASVSGPPSETAVMQKGMAKAAVNIGSIEPAPTSPTRRTCNSVHSPAISSDANTIHTRKLSSRPDALETTMGVTRSVAAAFRLN